MIPDWWSQGSGRMATWWAITKLGDAYLMAPAALAITMWLLIGDARRLAALWCLLFAASMGLVAVTKIAFMGWGIGIDSFDFTGFSGHSTSATAVIPVLFYLALQRAPGTLRRFGVAAGFAVGLLICLSRLAVHTHSPSEVIAGCILGNLVSTGFIFISAGMQKPVLHRGLIAFSLVALLASSYAEAAPTQRWLEHVALYLSGRDKPFTRGDA